MYSSLLTKYINNVIIVNPLQGHKRQNKYMIYMSMNECLSVCMVVFNFIKFGTFKIHSFIHYSSITAINYFNLFYFIILRFSLMRFVVTLNNNNNNKRLANGLIPFLPSYMHTCWHSHTIFICIANFLIYFYLIILIQKPNIEK